MLISMSNDYIVYTNKVVPSKCLKFIIWIVYYTQIFSNFGLWCTFHILTSNQIHNKFWLKLSLKNCGNDFDYITFIVCCDGINDDNSVELKGSCLGDKIQPDLVTVYTPNGDTLNDRNVYENEDQTLFLYYVASIEVNWPYSFVFIYLTLK